MTITNIHELDVLRWESLTDTVRKFPTTGPHWFRNNLFQTKKSLVGTDVVVWDEVTKGRKRAPYSVRGQPAQRLQPLTRGVRSASVADIFISKQLRADQIEFLRQYGTVNQPGAQAIINDELEDMNDLIDNTVEFACMSVARGSLSIDQTLSTTAVKSKGVKFTLTFPVSTLTLGAWSSASTAIYTTEMSAIFEKGYATGLGQPTRILHNAKIMDNLLTNTEVKSFLGEQYKTQLLRDGRISTIRGVDFFSYDTGDDESGAWAKYWPDNKLLIMPPDNKYFEIYEADALIPTPDLHGLTRSSPGKYSYAIVSPNPPGIELFVGYRFLPINRFAERIIVGTVT